MGISYGITVTTGFTAKDHITISMVTSYKIPKQLVKMVSTLKVTTIRCVTTRSIISKKTGSM